MMIGSVLKRTVPSSVSGILAFLFIAFALLPHCCDKPIPTLTLPLKGLEYKSSPPSRGRLKVGWVRDLCFFHYRHRDIRPGAGMTVNKPALRIADLERVVL